MPSYVLLLILSTLSLVVARYEPTWESLDARPLPPWYDEAKVGIFIHWGVFSVPSFGSEWFWWAWKGSKENATVEFMEKNYRPGFTYPDFGPMFTAEFFNPDEWADIFNASGARYVVLVSKHHEGFTNWPSKVSWNWNSMDVGPKRNLVGDLANSIRNKTHIRFGLYHSLFEWFNQLYLRDKANNFTTQDFVNDKTMPELYDLVNTYKPEIIWSDGEWEASNVYWKSKEFLAWLYNDSPVKDTVVTNDRWGKATLCKHGGYYTCTDRYDPGVLQKHKFENAMTLDKSSWGYVRNSNLKDYLTMDELLSTLASTISCGGNILINVGPTHDGRILPVFEERLRQLGQWLKVNGEGVYSTHPWAYQNDTVTHHVWYTMNNKTSTLSVFAIVLDWPEGSTLDLGVVAPTPSTVVSLLGYPGTFKWTKRPEGGISISIPPIPFNKMPCDWAWVFKFEGLDKTPIVNNYRIIHGDNAVIDMTMKYYPGVDNEV